MKLNTILYFSFSFSFFLNIIIIKKKNNLLQIVNNYIKKKKKKVLYYIYIENILTIRKN